MSVRVLITALALLAACNRAGAAADGELVVFAAASLTDAFEAIGAAFEEQQPNLQVAFNFGPSSGLATQIAEGAPGDVFASAALKQMDGLAAAGLLAAGAQTFTCNVLQIAVEPGNPKGVMGLADLARDDVVTVLAAPEVPAGQYAAQALANAGVMVRPASLEPDVRAVLSRVALGEADAGIVYRSDVVASAGTVDGVAISDDDNITASYPIAVLADAPNPAAAEAFIAFVLSDTGQALLGDAGFTTP